MKHWVQLILVIFICQLSWVWGDTTGTLKLKIEGVIPGKGQVRIALENNARDFESGPFETPRYLSKIEAAQGSTVTTSFSSVPYGTYAIKVFQDLDGDGKLKTGFMGAPDEPWGFSNDASGFMGPADFSDAKFSLDAPELEMTIHLKK